MAADPLDAFLTATDLDQLADAYDALAAGPDRTGRSTAIIRSWSDPQAVANLLMYPQLLPDAERTDALLRGLRDDGYLRLAAAVGVGVLQADHLEDGVRRAVLDALLDLVAGDAGPAGIRAAAEIGPLIRAEEVDLLDDLDGHPVDATRHNLTQARLGLTAPAEQVPVLLPYLANYGER